MEYIILYFSGTGNTALIAKEIASRLKNANHSVDIVSIEDEAQLERLNFKNKIIGFGYPVYKFSYPDIFNNVLPLIAKSSNNNEYFLFSTYARFVSDAFYDFSNYLEKYNFQFITQQSFKSPSCGISARKPVNDYEYESVMFFEDNITGKIDAFVSDILCKNKIMPKEKYRPFPNLKKRIVKDIEITKYPKLSIDTSQCITCGLCARNCPDHNLHISKSHIDIIDDIGCLHCLRCMNRCPVNAINFGQLTRGENQYTLKIRDTLYKKASRGYHEKYWGDFSNVIRKWRLNTIKYWIRNKISRDTSA